MKRKQLYVILFLIAVTFRLLLHYKTNLVPGLNGAYYLVQLRSIIENGWLGFDDLPLYFYLCAYGVKLIAFLTGWPIELISIHFVKIFDAIILPLSLIPIYHIFKELYSERLSLKTEGIILLTVLFSISPLIFLGDFQKNGFAIPLLFTFILFGIKYLKTTRLKFLLAMLITFGLIAISHFGVLVFTALLFGIGLVVVKGWRSFGVLLGLGAFTLIVVSLFDTSRANRLLTLAGSIFEQPVIFRLGPPELLIYGASLLILILSLLFYRKRKEQLSKTERIILKTGIALLAVLSFPLINGDYAHRMVLMLFVPQAILLYLIFDAQSRSMKNILVTLILIVTIFATTGMSFMKQPSITTEAYEDLKGIEDLIEDKENTLVIARHGLEWWVNWTLQIKVGNGKAVEEDLLDKYDTVLFLEEKHISRRPGPGMPFKEPKPDTGTLVEKFETEHFKVFEWEI